MFNSQSTNSLADLNRDLLIRVDAAESLLRDARATLGVERSADFEVIEGWISECRHQLTEPGFVSVALLGSTGAGKSTLINSLIDAQVLPTSSLAVCTSAITRVRYQADGDYSVEVSLVSKESWEKQIEQVVADIQASKQQDPEDGTYVAISPIPEDEKKRLIAVYGESAVTDFIHTGERSMLVEPENIADAFQQEVISFSTDSLEELRSEVGRYLTSKENYWPIVRTCLIRGPFNAISHGGELVDLPGLNDPNEAREEMTRQFIESAKFVWVVFNMKRSLGKDLTQVLESRDLINRLLAGGRVSTLTFIGTHADDVSSVNPEDFNLNDDSSAAEIALARNEEAERELRRNLSSIAQTIALGGHHEMVSTELESQFVRSPAFMVSASNHLQMMGRSKSKVPVIFEDPYETNVPQLGTHLKRIAVEAGPKANAFSLVTGLEQVVSEVASIAQTVKAQRVLAEKENQTSRESLLGEVRQASADLNQEMNDSVGRLRRSLQEAAARFKATSTIDKVVVERIVSERASKWRAMHWATMRATASRGGRYTSPTFGEQDFIRELSAPLIGRSIGPWKEFFERDLQILSKQSTDGLVAGITSFCARIEDFGDRMGGVDEILTNLLPDLAADVSESVEAAISLAQKNLNAELSRRQQELHSMAEKAIANSMTSVLSRAASQSGTGMKGRMVEILSVGSKTAVSGAVSEFESKIGGLADLAVKEVLAAVNPVVAQIVEKVARVKEMLEDRGTVEDQATVSEIDQLLSRLATVRSEVTKSIKAFDPTSESGTAGQVAASVGEVEEPNLLDIDVSKAEIVLVDASNVARSIPGGAPSIMHLRACKNAVEKHFTGCQTVMIADASLRHLVKNQAEPEELTLFDELVLEGSLIETPSGAVGKADSLILMNAKNLGAMVVSNDSFKEFQEEHSWLFDDQRLFGHSFHGSLGWQFPPRRPVRPRSY